MGRRQEKNKKKGKGTVVLVVLLILLIIIFGVLLYLKISNDKKKQNEDNNIVNEENNILVAELEEKQEEKEEPIKIYSGSDRPIAVMIDNVGGARPQVGLNDAYVVYEIIVEGGYSRLMPIFKGKDLEMIGPVRSARHYFLDYALENGAIYTHFGWSPQAQSDISTLEVENINGLVASSKQFWRVKEKQSPHNAVTSTEKIKEIAEKNGYNLTSKAKSVLNYSSKEINLEEGAEDATKIEIPYSTVYNVSYEYDEANKVYTRFEDGKEHKDWKSGEPITTKNIIITFAKNTVLNDGENKDRQDLDNIGTLEGYYITNGKAIKIECTKNSRTTKTIYKDVNGNEITVNDGNTFIQICPINANVVIE